MPKKAPHLLEWHINLDKPATQALIRSASNNSPSNAKELTENDLLDLRIRFYRDSDGGSAQQIRLGTPWSIGLNGKDADDLSGDELFRASSFGEDKIDETLILLRDVSKVDADGTKITVTGSGFLDGGEPTHAKLTDLVTLSEYNGSVYEVTDVSSTTMILDAAGTIGVEEVGKITTIDRTDWYYHDFLDLETTPLAALMSASDSEEVLVTVELANGNPSTRRKTVVRHTANILADTYDESDAEPDDLPTVIDGGDPNNAGLLSSIDGGTA